MLLGVPAALAARRLAFQFPKSASRGKGPIYCSASMELSCLKTSLFPSPTPIFAYFRNCSLMHSIPPLRRPQDGPAKLFLREIGRPPTLKCPLLSSLSSRLRPPFGRARPPWFASPARRPQDGPAGLFLGRLAEIHAKTERGLSDDGASRTTRAGLLSASGRPRCASAEMPRPGFRAANPPKKSPPPRLRLPHSPPSLPPPRSLLCPLPAPLPSLRPPPRLLSPKRKAAGIPSGRLPPLRAPAPPRP